MTVMGRASARMPQRAQMMPISFPTAVLGYTSPYPTVDIVTRAHHMQEGMLE